MTQDAALIIAAQKVEHYEIATYGGWVQLALTLGEYKAAELLEKHFRKKKIPTIHSRKLPKPQLILMLSRKTEATGPYINVYGFFMYYIQQ